MNWWRHLAALLLVGIVLSPLRAVAATVPVLMAYDAAVGPTYRYGGGGAAGSGTTGGLGRRTTRGGATPKYVYVVVPLAYDDAPEPPRKRALRAEAMATTMTAPSNTLTGVSFAMGG